MPIYEIIDSIINLIDLDKKIDKKIKKILNLSENEFNIFSKSIYNSVKFTDIIKNIFNLDNLSNNNSIYYSDLYKILKLDDNISSNAIKISFETYFDSIKNQIPIPIPNNNQNFIDNNNQNFIDNDILKIQNILRYYILLNSNTKKIYDKYYYIKIINKLNNNKFIDDTDFLSTFKKICTNTDFTFEYDYNSDDFIKTIKNIFLSVEKKKNKLNKYNSELNQDIYNIKKWSEYVFDDEYQNFILDKKLDEFIDLYKLFKLNIDMGQKDIEENFYLEEEKINMLNDIEKYIGYKILLNKKTRKIYDNYYLNYYIENWDKISVEFSNEYLTDKQNSLEILSQINFVYSNLYNSNTTISDEKLNSNEIISLVDAYNKECEEFIIKDKKTPEEIELININFMNNLNNRTNVDILSTHKLNENLKNCIDGRNAFLHSIPLYTNMEKEFNKIIQFNKEYKITPNDLIDYNKYKINQKSNTLAESLDFVSNIGIDIEKSYIILDDFNVNDFNLWKIKNNKLKEKITESDYFDYFEDRKINNKNLEKMYKNKLDMVEYYFNQNQ